MFIRLRKPQLFAGFACLLLAVATLPFVSAALASWSVPQQRVVWDRTDLSLPNPNNIGIEGTAITSDGLTLLSTEPQQGRVRVSDMTGANAGVISHTINLTGCPRAIVINSSDQYAYAGDRCNNAIWQINLSDWTFTNVVSSVCTNGGLTNLEISPTDNYVTAACTGFWSNSDTELHIVNLAGFAKTSVFPAATEPAVRMAINPAGTIVYTASKWGGSSIVSAYSLATGALLHSIDTGDSPEAGTGGITNIALNDDGTIIYVVKYNSAIAAWTDLSTAPRMLWRVNLSATVLHTVMLYSVSPFVVDNDRELGYFVHGNGGGIASGFQVVDLHDGSFLYDVATSETWSGGAVLSSDGSTLVISGARESNLLVWDVGLGSNPHATTTTTTTTIAPTTTEPATTTTVEEEETSSPSSSNVSNVEQELLPPTGGSSSQSALGVMLLVLVGATLIITARRRHEV